MNNFQWCNKFIHRVNLKSPSEKAKLRVNLHPLNSRHRVNIFSIISKFIHRVNLKSPGEKAKLRVNLHPLTSRHRVNIFSIMQQIYSSGELEVTRWKSNPPRSLTRWLSITGWIISDDATNLFIGWTWSHPVKRQLATIFHPLTSRHRVNKIEKLDFQPKFHCSFSVNQFSIS